LAKPTTARNSTNFGARPSQLAPSNVQTSPMPESFFAKYFLKCFQGFIAALGSLVLAACGNGTAPSIDEVGGFRVINAVSDSPAITFQLEGTTVGILEFGQASNFQSIPEGNFDLDAGFSAFGGATTFLLDDEGVSVETDEQTTLVLSRLIPPNFNYLTRQTQDHSTSISPKLMGLWTPCKQRCRRTPPQAYCCQHPEYARSA